MQSSADNDNWKPLESNPDVMNEYATVIGNSLTPSFLGLNT